MNRNLKTIEHKVDLCVVGGGIAGICTAISAARHGLKVALMHDRPMFGGNTSSEVRMWLSGAAGENNLETGIVEELSLENLYRNPYRSFPIWDSILFGAIKEEKNIVSMLNCSCNDVEMEGAKIKKVYGWQTTSQIWHCVEANYFADCSGDSILAPLTGAEFRMGRESKDEFAEDAAPIVADKKTMGNSCLIQAREMDSKRDYIPPKWAKKFTKNELDRHDFNLNCAILNFCVFETGGEKDTIHDAEEIRDELIDIAYGAWDYIKHDDKYETDNWELDFVGYLPGKRESRRYVGDHILTQGDIENEGRFNDLIAYGGWPMDDHNPKGLYADCFNINYPAPSPYGIPYRCVYSKNIENLFFAGRNISTTHMAMSSTRVMSTCATLGQAVGTAAAIAFKYKTTPRDIYISHIDELKQALMEDDCYLPFNRMEMSDIVKEAKISSTGTNAHKLVNGYDRPIGNEMNCWSGKVGDNILFEFENEREISEIRFVFDSDLNRETVFSRALREDEKHLSRKPTICNIPKDNPKVSIPKTLVGALTIEALDKDGNYTMISNIKNNYQRLVKFKSKFKAHGIRITIDETRGNEEINIFSVNIK